MATSGERNTPQRAGDFYSYDLAVDAKINKGAIVCLEAGLAKAGFVAAGLIVRGIAAESVDYAAGDRQVQVRRGVFRFKNSAAADEIVAADIGRDCYLVDDETVAKTHATNTRSVAGKVQDVEGANVWIEF